MGLVQVILSEDVHALGDAGEIVSVKPGFARNFLVPQGKAVLATSERVYQIEHQQRVIIEKRAKDSSDLEAVKAKLDKIELEIEVAAAHKGVATEGPALGGVLMNLPDHGDLTAAGEAKLVAAVPVGRHLTPKVEIGARQEANGTGDSTPARLDVGLKDESRVRVDVQRTSPPLE